MALSRKSAWTVMRRTVGLFLLGVFLQWAGMTHPAAQEGTVYAAVAHLIAPGSSAGSLARLPQQ